MFYKKKNEWNKDKQELLSFNEEFLYSFLKQ